MSEFEKFSVITCPHCGHEAREEMPTNACQFFYDCSACGQLLRPNEGDCCVFALSAPLCAHPFNCSRAAAMSNKP